jgi:hypothetical protein
MWVAVEYFKEFTSITHAVGPVVLQHHDACVCEPNQHKRQYKADVDSILYHLVKGCEWVYEST